MAAGGFGWIAFDLVVAGLLLLPLTAGPLFSLCFERVHAHRGERRKARGTDIVETSCPFFSAGTAPSIVSFVFSCSSISKKNTTPLITPAPSSIAPLPAPLPVSYTHPYPNPPATTSTPPPPSNQIESIPFA